MRWFIISEQEAKKPHQLLDRPFPLPPNAPKNTHASVNRDSKCSSPNCPNYASSNCGFCKLHCMRFHRGRHYRTRSSLEIETLLEKYKSDKRLA